MRPQSFRFLFQNRLRFDMLSPLPWLLVLIVKLFCVSTLVSRSPPSALAVRRRSRFHHVIVLFRVVLGRFELPTSTLSV